MALILHSILSVAIQTLINIIFYYIALFTFSYLLYTNFIIIQLQPHTHSFHKFITSSLNTTNFLLSFHYIFLLPMLPIYSTINIIIPFITINPTSHNNHKPINHIQSYIKRPAYTKTFINYQTLILYSI
jgi:hypothetical protein